MFPVHHHSSDVIWGAIASQITSVTIVYSTVCSSVNQRPHQSSAPLPFVRGIHRWPVNSSHKWPVTRKMFPFDNVIMWNHHGSSRHMVAELRKWKLFEKTLIICMINRWYIQLQLWEKEFVWYQFISKIKSNFGDSKRARFESTAVW